MIILTNGVLQARGVILARGITLTNGIIQAEEVHIDLPVTIIDRPGSTEDDQRTGGSMSKEPFGRWIKSQRQALGLTGAECTERVNQAFPPKPDGSPAITRSGWAWYENYQQKGRVDPETIKKVAVGLGLDESVVADAAPQYVDTPTPHELWRLRLGAYLKKGREGKYSQEELAYRTGIPRSTIAGYETGSFEPSIGALRILLAELGLSADEALELPGASRAALTGAASGRDGNGRDTVAESEWREWVKTKVEEQIVLLQRLTSP